MESLSTAIPPSCLPKEYGGDATGLSLASMLAKWDEIFAMNQSFFDANYHNVSNEKNRVDSVGYSTEIFGFDGTFKKLNID